MFDWWGWPDFLLFRLRLRLVPHGNIAWRNVDLENPKNFELGQDLADFFEVFRAELVLFIGPPFAAERRKPRREFVEVGARETEDEGAGNE